MPGTLGVVLTLLAFFFALTLILWRPKGLNEAIPAAAGALLVLTSGSVSFSELTHILSLISGASVIIIATIAMAIILESFGFYQWAAEGLAARAKGSGIRLFWYINLLCFLMTLFFNNDGSIIITTPILILLLERLRIRNVQKIPYLLSGALIATASSAPIGVSNIVNLIALDIVGMNLTEQMVMMFVPSMIGLFLLLCLLFLCFRKFLPQQLPELELQRNDSQKGQEHNRLMRNVLVFIFSVRISLYAASYFEIPVEFVAVAGTAIMLGWRWAYLNVSPADMLKKTPWHIFVFASGMYVMIYGLNNIGLSRVLIEFLQPLISESVIQASYLMGWLLTLMSISFNNHPALLIGMLTLASMPVDSTMLKAAYLASIIGSDIGSLILPIGTLASLLWLNILKQHRIEFKWKQYLKVTTIVIPPTLMVTLGLLAMWINWLNG